LDVVLVGVGVPVLPNWAIAEVQEMSNKNSIKMRFIWCLKGAKLI